MTEQAFHLGIGIAESTKQGSCRQFAVLIDLDIDNVVDIGFELEPGAPVGDHGGGEGTLTVGINFSLEVNTRASHNLRNDNALGTINNECTAVGHHRNIADVDLLFFDLTHFPVDQAHLNTQLFGEAGIERTSLFGGLGLVRLSMILEVVVGQKVQFETAGVILNRTKGTQFFCEPLFNEPFERTFLNFGEIGQIGNARRTGPEGSYALRQL